MLKIEDLKSLISRYAKVAAEDNDDRFYLPLFTAGEEEFWSLTHENFFKLLRQIPKFMKFDDSVAIDGGEKVFYTSTFATVIIGLMHNKAQGYIEFHIMAPTKEDSEGEAVHYFNEGTEFDEFFDEFEQELENGIDEGL